MGLKIITLEGVLIYGDYYNQIQIFNLEGIIPEQLTLNPYKTLA
jgi:hypothetical protein